MVAGLVEEVWLPWEDKTEYNNENFTAMDRKWGELRADNGIITLPKTYAAEHGLQRGSEFPWDSSKDIYLLNGYHGIHCLVSYSLWGPTHLRPTNTVLFTRANYTLL